jgi:hypothetical protein
MSKPNPSITADLLNHLSAKKGILPKEVSSLPEKKDYTNRPQPQSSKISSRSAEKGMVLSRTRTSARGK